MTHKLYDVLGVTSSATQDEIKKAFRKKALSCHPDRGGDETAFKALNHAYEVLSGDERQAYDKFGDEGFDQQGGMQHQQHQQMPNMDDLFGSFFGGFNPFGGGQGHGGHGQQRREVKRHTITLELKEAYFGCKKGVSISFQRACTSCLKTCDACGGQGKVGRQIQLGPGMITTIVQPCGACQGLGRRAHGHCSICNSGIVEEHKHFQVDVPRGADADFELMIKLHDAADLQVKLNILPDKHFQRLGHDLLHNVNIEMSDAIAGTALTIPLFDSVLEIETRTDLGIIDATKRYAVQGRGMPQNGHASRFGNLILQFHIKLPSKTKLSEEDGRQIRELFKKLDLEK